MVYTTLKKYWYWCIIVPLGVYFLYSQFTSWEHSRIETAKQAMLKENGYEVQKCESIVKIQPEPFFTEEIVGLGSTIKASKKKPLKKRNIVLNAKPDSVINYYAPRIGDKGQVIHYDKKTKTWH